MADFFRKIIKYKMITAFTVFTAFFFILYLIKPDTVFSEQENRYLKERPRLTFAGLLDTSFMNGFETYTTEQLPFRDEFIKLKAFAENLQLKKENNGIVRGRDGQLFEKAIVYNKNLERNMELISAFAEKTERPLYFSIIPNSFEIQKDRLPKGLVLIDEQIKIQDLYDRLLKYQDCSTIDIYAILKEHSDEEIYYRTDHHWTTEGAYYGYLKICEKMDLDPVNLKDLKEKRAEGFLGTYYSKYKGLGVKPDSILYYDIPVQSYSSAGEAGQAYDGLYDLSKLSVYDKYSMFLYGNPGLGVIESGSDTNKELIIFKDSYSNCLIPFLTFNYGRITVVDLRYYGGDVSELLSDDIDADILMLYNFMQFSEDSNLYKLLKKTP